MRYQCAVCGQKVEDDLVVYMKHTEKHIIEEIKRQHPQWVQENGLCPPCIEYFRKQMKGEN